ncbi:hypothetical protein Hanom_Chr08g00720691 [Helianthus anomalus]
MHNVQDLKHKKTQTIYPSTDSSLAVHLSHFFTWIAIFNRPLQFTRIAIFIRPSISLTTHTSHKLHQTFSISPSLSQVTQEHHPPSLSGDSESKSES